MNVTCCDQIRTISSLQNVLATTLKRACFFLKVTFKDQKTLMMNIVELIKKVLSFGQPPPRLPNMVQHGATSRNGFPECSIHLIR